MAWWTVAAGVAALQCKQVHLLTGGGSTSSMKQPQKGVKRTVLRSVSALVLEVGRLGCSYSRPHWGQVCLLAGEGSRGARRGAIPTG